MPPVTTRIFPSAENPLDLALELSEKLRFSEPCPLSLSDGFRAAYPDPPTGSRDPMGCAKLFAGQAPPVRRFALQNVIMAAMTDCDASAEPSCRANASTNSMRSAAGCRFP